MVRNLFTFLCHHLCSLTSSLRCLLYYLHEEVTIDMTLDEVLHAKISQSDQKVERTIPHRNQSILEDSS